MKDLRLKEFDTERIFGVNREVTSSHPVLNTNPV